MSVWAIGYLCGKMVFLSLLATVSLLFFSVPESDGVFQAEKFDYQILSSSQGVSGERLVTIRCLCDDMKEIDAVIARSVVHAFIFTGCPGDGGFPAMNPLFEGPLDENAVKYFNEFFFVDENAPDHIKTIMHSHKKIIKARKKSVYVEVPVVVDIRKLRRTLENAGVIRRLGQGLQNQ